MVKKLPRGNTLKIQWVRTAHKGLRYYEHTTRKHGKRKDRYYSIRFKVDGVNYDYGVGWWSEGIPEEIRKDHTGWGFEDYAISELHRYKANVKAGSGVKSPKEKRAVAEEKRKEEERAAMSFCNYCKDNYFPWADQNKKPNSLRSEKNFSRVWVNPAFGNVPMLHVTEIHLERLKKAMVDRGRAPKTINLALAFVRQVFNHAKHRGAYVGDNPISKVKMLAVDNAKLRYLTAEEINRLLNALKEKSLHVHDQALLSAHTGLRFSEAAGLRWEDVNYATGTVAIRDSKTGSRTVFMNETVAEMLKSRQGDQRKGLVFPDEDGKQQARVSKTFQRAADDLFNKDIRDRRLRVTYHTLRHSFGTLVYGNSGDLYLTQKALGHKTIVMAQRYAKMSEARLKDAFNKMSETLRKAREAGQG